MPEPRFSARAPWRTPCFQPRRKAERPCRSSPRASSRFPSVPPCPSLKTCTLGSVSFHTLGLSLFSSSCPSLRFRPVRHGEPLVRSVEQTFELQSRFDLVSLLLLEDNNLITHRLGGVSAKL